MDGPKTAAASGDLLGLALGRWAAVAGRLGLSDGGGRLGASVLRLDAGASGNGAALTRARLIEAASSELETSAALVALQELEEAGVLEAVAEDAARPEREDPTDVGVPPPRVKTEDTREDRRQTRPTLTLPGRRQTPRQETDRRPDRR